MSNYLKRSLTLSLPLFFFISCSGQITESIFTKGKKWEYKCNIYSIEEKVIDSFTIDMKVQSNITAILSQQIPIIYEYPHNGKIIKETTGIIEDKSGISIHQPRLGSLNFTAILPMPSVNFPLGSNSESESETKIIKSSFEEINGKTIKQAKRSAGTDTLLYKGEVVNCYVYEAENLSEIEEAGKYYLKYWFNEHYGFVRYLYTKPDGSSIDIKLVDIKN